MADIALALEATPVIDTQVVVTFTLTDVAPFAAHSGGGFLVTLEGINGTDYTDSTTVASDATQATLDAPAAGEYVAKVRRLSSLGVELGDEVTSDSVFGGFITRVAAFN